MRYFCMQCGVWIAPSRSVAEHEASQAHRTVAAFPCSRWTNDVPLGWGDHIRWQHEITHHVVGEKHALARREASAIRSRAFIAFLRGGVR